MRFDFTDLRLFVLAVRRGSITRAAQEAHLALASASLRISALEKNFGAPLLERLPRGVRATPAGNAFLNHAEEMLERAARLAGEMEEYRSGGRGQVRLLCNTGALLHFVPDALASFLASHPHLDVDIREHMSAEIVRLLGEKACEIGIATDAVEAGALQTRLLTADRLVLLTPAGHPLSANAAVTFDEALKQPLIGLLDAALETHLAEHAARHGARLHHRVRLRGVADIARMVAEGIGLAILPESATRSAQHFGLKATPLAERWAQRNLLFYARDFSALTPNAAALVRHFGDHAKRWSEAEAPFHTQEG